MNPAVLHALIAAVLFGVSTPLAKILAAELSPVLLAGLLYLGSGIGLAWLRLVRDRGWKPSGLGRADWPWLLGAALFGGMIGPVALMFGLARTSGASASLLLNLEPVLTALLAWLVFREHTSLRVVIGMAAIVADGAALAWPAADGDAQGVGLLAVGFACLCWAIDNNLTRHVAAADAVLVACVKGLVAGIVNTALALALGAALAGAVTVIGTLALGLMGYGISLVFFVLALRGLGTARTGAYFSTAPFIGAIAAIVLLDESVSPALLMAAALMALGVWLHLTEHHEHDHRREALEHAHAHVHDEHHEHDHDFPWDGAEPRTHWHRHGALFHRHPHFPDIHHRHPH
ncbi:MAG: DMT family transporter [Thiohalomonadaceae bacterium]